jgi:adenylate cyclase class 2
MSYEVEVKYRSGQHDRVRQQLLARGAVEQAAVAQEDVYLSHPSRDFAATNEALRLRRTGDENRITYKGPRHDGPTKTREEIEILLSATGEEGFRQLARLFENLGFRPAAAIRKRRTTFHLPDPSHPIEVALDEAEGLGDFVEIETVVRERSELPAAQSAVLLLADELDLRDIEPRSYLRMAVEVRH